MLKFVAVIVLLLMVRITLQLDDIETQLRTTQLIIYNKWRKKDGEV